MKILGSALAVLLAACGASENARPAASSTGSESSSPTPGATNACERSGGSCSNKLAMNACVRFEENAKWGCGANEGCCLN